MAEPLKNQYGPEIPIKIGQTISSVYAEFNTSRFTEDCLLGYEDLELTPRARHICQQMAHYLPANFESAITILLASLGDELDNTEEFGMGPFMYLPHVFFVAEYGTDHFEHAMQAQFELTQRFTAEFSIRTFLQKYPEETLKRLTIWATDPSPHVRRLVSEGTRPRLPWAQRLPDFQQDPKPVIQLLELLKDDPSLYVRRSVANNLNDIYKDNPDTINKLAQNWMQGANKQRVWVINHGLRSAVKAGDSFALQTLGFTVPVEINIEESHIIPAKAKIGEKISLSIILENQSNKVQSLLIDCKLHFVKANGQTSPKVFKLKQCKLSPGKKVQISKVITLKNLTTRRHYPGKHNITLMINGEEQEMGYFNLIDM